MSEVIDFPRCQQHLAVARLQGLTNVMSDLHGMDLRTQGDMRQALWILDLTNRCIRAILSDFRDDPCFNNLIRRAEKLTASVEGARRMVHDLGRSALHNASARRH